MPICFIYRPVIFLFLLPCSVLAASPPIIVINEIAWMGTERSFSDEWIELYNNSNEPISLDGWKLQALDGKPTIALKGEIPAKGFFLLERTDEESVPSVEADLIYQGALKNGGEHLKLIDHQARTVDEINCLTGWFSGDNKTKKTMERKNPLLSGNLPANWQTSQSPGGTPKTENSSLEIEKAKTNSRSLEIESIAYVSGIFINEILPSPQGADAENEWIEIFNANDFEVELWGWQIKDATGATKTYAFPKDTKIQANNFLVLPRTQSKIVLQNNGDGLKLLSPLEEVVHQVNYAKAPRNQSYNRTASGWVWSATLTPGKENIISLPEAPEVKTKKDSFTRERQTEEARQNEKKQGSSSLQKATTAKIGENMPESSNRLLILLSGLIIAICSAIIVLVIKKKLNQSRSL